MLLNFLNNFLTWIIVIIITLLINLFQRQNAFNSLFNQLNLKERQGHYILLNFELFSI